MEKYFKNRMEDIEKRKNSLEKEENYLNELQDTWNFFKNNNSKKHLHFPTMSELIDYYDTVLDEDEQVIPDYKNLDYDLAYFKMVLNEIKNYDFFVPFKFYKRKIKPQDIKDLRISEPYIEFVESIYYKLKESKEKSN